MFNLAVCKSVCQKFLGTRLRMLAAVVLLGAVPLVGPYGWSIGAQGDCAGGRPKGASWLNWYGYNLWSWGESSHNLQWYNPGTGLWETHAYANGGRMYGITNSSVANSSTGFRAGAWAVASTNAANFTAVTPHTQGRFEC